jgi:ribosomal protein L37AE/L43A
LLGDPLAIIGSCVQFGSRVSRALRRSRVSRMNTYPTVPLYCFECKFNSIDRVDCHLVHDRHNWSKNKTLFPLWTFSGVPTWCVLAKYTCPNCKNKYEANDARLLWVLEADVSNSYPVLPNYANGTFHFHKDLTDLMDGFMRTYGNGS